MSSARELALVKSIAVHVVLYTKDKLPEVAKRTKQVTDYHKTVVELSPEQRATYVSPHVSVWLEIVHILIEEFKEQQEANSKILREHMKNVQVEAQRARSGVEGQVQQGGGQGRSLRDVRKTSCGAVCESGGGHQVLPAEANAGGAHDDDGNGADEARRVIMHYLAEKGGGEVKPGPAPKGALERKESQGIEKLIKQKELGSLVEADLTLKEE
eukprot:TRINITY_DN100496_c0_g1_i1.p1 TRINITY_DN100496_c0_g1~~TRINITY_DN100496_c0_g1_i1.p1  ORF type:complete len:213 (+),score=61.75 TRINITY_DN100496_c0_g1_i1:201-839(+)